VRRTLLVAGGVVVLALLVIFGYRYYYTGQHYVSTDNALVTGDLVQVAPTNGGRVSNLKVEIGDIVKQNQALGSVDVSMPSTLGLAPNSSGGPVQGTNITSQLVSPVTGVVVAKPAVQGDQVSPGQPVLTLVDLGRLWITANINESEISRINVGQSADVHVDTLNKTLKGTVASITPASAATFSLIPQNNTAGNYTKVTQYVPVNIAVDYAGYTLFPGTSVEVTIKVA
jgi:multidrug resistance efflux pump